MECNTPGRPQAPITQGNKAARQKGCYAEGETEEEARTNIREGAIEAHIESRLAHGDLIYTEIRSEAISLAL